MPTAYFRAKYLWNHGERDPAFELLRQAIAGSIGADPFVRPDYWMAGASSAFESVVVDLLTGTFLNSARPFLLAPFGRVWAALWKLDHFDYWLHVLLGYNFFAAPEALGFDEEELAAPANDDLDFEAIVGVLDETARKGGLSPNLEDRPNGGRAVLALEKIDAVDDARWGALKPRLRTRLAAAYAASPADPWKRRVEDEPDGVVIELLHDLFGRHGSPNSAIQPRWDAINARHPAYANAVRAALQKLLRAASTADLTPIVTFDAGRDVPDGAAWLQALAKALDTGAFLDLG
jgi:hypothetical protein